MKIFHYHPETGALLGEGKADPSPLEPGKWLVPAHATAIEPLHPNNDEQVIWVNNNWQLRPIPEPEPPSEPEPTEPLPPPPSYIAFWDALLASTVYGSIREQSMTSLPMNTLTTEFIALIGDAKVGRPSVARIQASMAAILTTGTFTAAHLADIGAALAAGNLADTFSIGAPDP
jgi:hypothetical protein